jgi:hypothetical protein
MKRGFHGPFTCALCQRNQDSILHLFWECPFSIKVWEFVYREINHQIRWLSNFIPFLGHWEIYYQGSFHREPIFKILWKSMPKFVCWNIWIARNRLIFQAKMSQCQSVSCKSIAQLIEVMKTKNMSIEDQINWNTYEKSWISNLNIHSSRSPYYLQRS